MLAQIRMMMSSRYKGVRDLEIPAQQLHAAAVEIQIGDAGHRRDDEIDQALFVFVPGGVGGVVQVARQHGRNEQHHIDAVFQMERHKGQGNQHDAQHKDQARAPGFALGQGAVHRVGPAMVLGQAAAEQAGKQPRKHERQQERQRIHPALANDRQ